MISLRSKKISYLDIQLIYRHIKCHKHNLEKVHESTIESKLQIRCLLFFFQPKSTTAPDKWSIQKIIFSHFSMKTYVMGIHKEHLIEELLISTHNICFLGEIRTRGP